ncbi:Bifunctional dehydrogenase and ferrochelatase [Lithohypha guttulata]|uniref:precorrin-2 dehydrogenase n=1 Tax=Lithohypha guttulata TaxID=1690604 RepID=A0AAN7Y7B8_9EURO|nr:Bifunctional dehydrogenase and ferrochelatase [Lithohypha guttulata]KAK5087118.1 Bifunctional dehydrogenase and ferrochelatase [Lithohypha guttulata]
MVASYPEVQGGGSLILAWQIKNKNVLVVGGGEVAAGRVLNLLNADARVTVVCPKEGLNDEVAFRIQQGQVQHLNRVFLPIDLEPEKNVAMVLTAIDDPDASTRIWKYCKKVKVPANIADVPPECDFYFGSVHRDGPLQIMVSTNGNGPRLAAAIRRQIGDMLPAGTGDSIKKVGQLRRKLRRIAPGKGTEDISSRMTWMSKVCDQWSTEEFNAMDDEDMDELVSYYTEGTVPSFESIRLGSKDEAVVWEFDGSFGWM